MKCFQTSVPKRTLLSLEVSTIGLEAGCLNNENSLRLFLLCSWAILFSHPADFTPVCTTELARCAELAPEFKKRNIKLLALSCDSVGSHNEWIKDIVTYSNSTTDGEHLLDIG